MPEKENYRPPVGECKGDLSTFFRPAFERLLTGRLLQVCCNRTACIFKAKLTNGSVLTVAFEKSERRQETREPVVEEEIRETAASRRSPHSAAAAAAVALIVPPMSFGFSAAATRSRDAHRSSSWKSMLNGGNANTNIREWPGQLSLHSYPRPSLDSSLCFGGFCLQETLLDELLKY